MGAIGVLSIRISTWSGIRISGVSRRSCISKSWKIRRAQRRVRRPRVDSAFLEPYYAAAGRPGDPGACLAQPVAKGSNPPTTREEAEAIALTVRQSEFFDAEFYGRGLPQGMDPALHYVVIGEALEWAPSSLSIRISTWSGIRVSGIPRRSCIFKIMENPRG